jgi:hypothetical protein
MRPILFPMLCALLAGCAHTPPTILATQSQPVIRAPLLQPGCLLPSPQTINAGSPGSIEILLNISGKGVPENAVVLKSSGLESRDSAFRQAAMACAFDPATSFVPSTGERKTTSGEYKLNYAWEAGQQLIGVSRCFVPDYPEASRRLDEMAYVYVDFRQERPDSPFEFRATSSHPAPRLTAASLAATQRCLAHPEARAGLSAGRWYRVPFDWRLQ